MISTVTTENETRKLYWEGEGREGREGEKKSAFYAASLVPIFFSSCGKRQKAGPAQLPPEKTSGCPEIIHLVPCRFSIFYPRFPERARAREKENRPRIAAMDLLFFPFLLQSRGRCGKPQHFFFSFFFATVLFFFFFFFFYDGVFREKKKRSGEGEREKEGKKESEFSPLSLLCDSSAALRVSTLSLPLEKKKKKC